MTNKNIRSVRTLDLSALDAVAGGTGLSGILHFGAANQFAGHGGVNGAPSGIQAAPEVPPGANDSDWGAFDLPDVDIGNDWNLSELDSGLVPAGGGSFVNDFHSSSGGNTISIHQESSLPNGNHVSINGVDVI